MSGHTPGPWFVGVSADNGIHCVESGSKEVCEVWGTANDKIETEESQANARLIAAAPELLHCLKVIVCHAKGLDIGAALHLDKAMEVIAKAEGDA